MLYDVIIIVEGPAGLTAGPYSIRAKYRPVCNRNFKSISPSHPFNNKL